MINLIEEVEINIQKQMDMYSDRLIHGGVADWADYKRLVGLVHGLKQAQGIIEDSARKLLED